MKLGQKQQKDKTTGQTIMTTLKNRASISTYLRHAEDLGFMWDSHEKAKETVQIFSKLVGNHNLQVSQAETEYIIYHKDIDLKKEHREQN